MKLLPLILILFIPTIAFAGAAKEPEGFRDFAFQFRSAHEAGDFSKVSELICWDRVDADAKASFERHTSREFGRSISSVSFEALSEDSMLEYEQNGITYRPNLDPIGFLVVRYPTQELDSTAATAMHFMLGRKEGKLRIITAAPVSE